MGRKKLDSNEKRKEVIQVRVTVDEWLTAEKQASLYGFKTVSSYIRNLIKHDKPL
jgi:hypothetical protein